MKDTETEDYWRTLNNLDLDFEIPVDFSFNDVIKNPVLIAKALKAPSHVKPENVSFICIGADSRCGLHEDYDLKAVFNKARKLDSCDHPGYNGTRWVNGKWIHSFSISYFKDEKELSGDFYPDTKNVHVNCDADKFCFDNVYAKMQWAEDGIYQTFETVYFHDMPNIVFSCYSVLRRNVKSDPRPEDAVFRLGRTRYVVEVEHPARKTLQESISAALGEKSYIGNPGRVVYHLGDPTITKVCAFSTWCAWASRRDAIVKARAQVVMIDEKARGTDYTKKRV